MESCKHIALSLSQAVQKEYAHGCMLQVDLQLVNEELQTLRPAHRGAPDPVSKLWPNHYSTHVQKSHESGDDLS